jgi:hypothetical protein
MRFLKAGIGALIGAWILTALLPFLPYWPWFVLLFVVLLLIVPPSKQPPEQHSP